MHDPERRHYPRIKAKVPVELRCPGTAPMRTATDEISIGGCYIETMFTMDIGTNVELVLSLDGENIHATGTIATKYPQVGNGIDFQNMSAAESKKLSDFVSKHEHDQES